ncbi:MULTISPECIES: acyltransferase family protein [unclassified Pseudomonas]|uniref:acyltransferase family protein n=1 Tax=unclassified Pseudomonas TaxID=196821 RepID=UPI000A1EE440|nr:MULTISPECIES: acyltransferase family protein [unclassified Pseudomonas]
MTLIRNDIQALRGLAVALVVLDHIGLKYLKNGYLGVDIFFVISGFLITSIISGKLKEGSFSFSEFYLRRARRLLPSAFATIVLTSIGSVFFLNSIELQALQSQILGALTFSINFVLWGQTGYFDVSAGYKPLLHLWSLAVEEQFYLILPLLLIICPRRLWLYAITTLIGVSAGACAYLMSVDTSAAFYLLPSRAWELLLGSAGAFLIHSGKVKSFSKILLVPSIVGLLIVQFFSSGFPHPGLDAVIVCVLTLIIILACSQKLNRLWLLKPAARLGDISYPLYLVHWPIIVFMNSSYIGPIPIGTKFGVVVLSVVLAIFMHKAIENPLRFAGNRVLPTLSAYAAAAIVVFGFHLAVIALSKPTIDFTVNRLPNVGLDKLCDNFNFTDSAKCKTSENPTTLIWGDSYAMHSVPGLVRSQNIDLRQATLSACPPFIGSSPYNPKNPYPQKIKNCIAFNDKVLQFIKEHDEIKTVILGASFAGYANVGGKLSVRQQNGSDNLIIDTGLPNLKKDIKNTIDEIRATGKNVVVISTTPAISTQNLNCMERTLSGKISFGDNLDCGKPRVIFDRQTKNVQEFYSYLESELNIKVVKLSDTLCNALSCVSILDGIPIYRDEGHLSVVGSVKVFSLAPQVIE